MKHRETIRAAPNAGFEGGKLKTMKRVKKETGAMA